jgi:hypothetical protein
MGSYGTTPDGRQKPDLQAPTNCETASARAVDASAFFDGTSGAAPFAAGAAVLFRNWLNAAQGSIVDPGQVYSMMMLAGSSRKPMLPNDSGVGIIKWPSGSCRFGKIGLTTAYRVCEIPIIIDSPVKQIDVALWWPERTPDPTTLAPDAYHNDVNFRLLDPSRNQRAAGLAATGVFERNGLDSGPAGTWILRIEGQALRDLPQVVYWTVAIR